MKSGKFFIVLLLACLALIFGFWGIWNKRKNTPESGFEAIIVPHYMIDQNLVKAAYKAVKNKKNFNPQNVIIISPNHFGIGKKNFESIPSECKNICFGNSCLSAGTLVAGEFIGDGIGRIYFSSKDDLVFFSGENCFVTDHGIGEQLKFVKEYFPDAKVFPVVVRNSFVGDEEFVDFLKKRFSRKQTLLIFSVDMSHYNSENRAYLHDKKTIYTLNYGQNLQDFRNLEVDCPECLFIAKSFFDKWKFLGRNSSALKYGSKDPNQNTSVMTFIGKKNNQGVNGLTVAFFGDGMFDRFISKFYPDKKSFYKFTQEFFQQSDINKNLKFNWNRKLFGIDFVGFNLESPVLKYTGNCQKVPKFVNFVSDEKYLFWIKSLGFNLVNLANNHTLDCGFSGYFFTKNSLKSAGIKYFGKVGDFDNIFTGQKRGIKFAWFGRNVLQDLNSSGHICKLLKSYEKKGFINFVVVHRGKEFENKKNTEQSKVGRFLIDCGADLVIGSHPHVIQEYEVYNGKLIIYSLGNFIFDQFNYKNGNIGAYVLVNLDEKGNIKWFKLGKFVISVGKIRFLDR